jgi:hypothetical protein
MNESVKILLESKSLFQTIMSETYKSVLRKDFDKLSEKPEDADEFFRIIPINLSNEYFLSYIMAYEYILNTLYNHDPKKFHTIHKGTPFYFLGTQSFIIGDFERAVFYMDVALSEDKRSYPFLKNTPAKLFFALDSTDPNQLALDIVKRIKELIESLFEKVKASGGPYLKHRDIVNILIDSPTSEIRTIATSYLTFLFEYETRKSQLILSPEKVGTGEPFLLHLIKGVIIFESLLANSERGKQIKRKRLGDYLKDDTITSKLGLDCKQDGLHPESYEDLILKVLEIKSRGAKYSHQCIRVTWGVRNLLTHTIGWPKPNPKEYDILFNYIFGAICFAINGLYSKDTK